MEPRHFHDRSNESVVSLTTWTPLASYSRAMEQRTTAYLFLNSCMFTMHSSTPGLCARTLLQDKVLVYIRYDKLHGKDVREDGREQCRAKMIITTPFCTELASYWQCTH